MAGGTGGHVFPALAVARLLRARNERVVWLGTPRGLEAQVVPREGFELQPVRVSGIRRKGVVTWLLAPVQLIRALSDAWRILRRLRPKVVLGMGGFASGPGGVAAWLLRRPLIIHEQNAVAGLTNRLLAGLAREVLEAFPGSFATRVKARLVGNPVRADILALPAPEARLGARQNRLRILVLGGSQGARALNETVPAGIALLAAEIRPEVWHQAGASMLDIARSAYERARVAGRVEPFIDDMAAAYLWADLVICRAGALTIAELTAVGLGALLVPFPGAVDDHQTRNAEYLVRAGAAVLIPQAELTPERIAEELLRCHEDRALVRERAICARRVAHPGATEALADICIAVGGVA
jgi:UDP-N-acetylglucosamine--N-acetylmuramyl-(pentapeptide) pyrophosphoryl-undecaprenol N-acetylglucosamine transferase